MIGEFQLPTLPPLPELPITLPVITAEIWDIIATVILILLITGLMLYIASFFIASHILFKRHLKRRNKQMWGRDCIPEHPLLQKMYDEGIAWSEENRSCCQQLQIVSDGLNLYGEYFDFGFQRAVILVLGRSETLCHSYYFAKPYVDSGYNILAIDQRAHGLSDGEYNTLGFEEYKDVIAWGKLLRTSYGIKSIVLHGNCIGCSCCLQVLTSPDCPDFFTGMVAEGMYPTFYENFRNHLIDLKRPVHPYIDLMNMWMRLYTGHTMKKGPADMIAKCDKPILMLHSQSDLYSLPSAAQRLYDQCNSKKRLVWFYKGDHSQVRIQNTEQYDQAITEFLKEHFLREP